MPEQLQPREYTSDLTKGYTNESKERLKELEQILAVMSPAELATAMVDFIHASQNILARFTSRRPDYFETAYRESIADALKIGQEIAIDQCIAARDLGDSTSQENFYTIYDAVRFEYEMLTDPSFHPVTIPVSCDKIYKLVSKEDT